MPDESFTKRKPKVGYSSTDSYSVLLGSCNGHLRPSITNSNICRGASGKGNSRYRNRKRKVNAKQDLAHRIGIHLWGVPDPD
jgi:hypothetical protein